MLAAGADAAVKVSAMAVLGQKQGRCIVPLFLDLAGAASVDDWAGFNSSEWL